MDEQKNLRKENEKSFYETLIVFLAMFVIISLFLVFLNGCGSADQQEINHTPAINNSSFNKWPNGEILYRFEDNTPLDLKQSVIKAFDKIEDSTECIYFIESEDNSSVLIYQIEGTTSHASVGYLNTGTILAFSKKASKYTIYHEIFHTIGFRHEHNRPDRDQYIEVLYKNIEPEGFDSFDINTHHLYDIEKFPYDSNSITHYSPLIYSKNGHSSIFFLQENYMNLKEPTELDYQKIADIYSNI